MSQQISGAATSAREAYRNQDGKFGAQPAHESDVDLGAAATDWSMNGTVEDADVLAACKKFARVTGARYRIDDTDELAGETALHWLRYVTNRREKVLSGREEPQPAFRYERHIGQIATGLGQRTASGLKNGGRDLTALTKYLKTREGFETRYGRPMTTREEDELADEIRKSFPPGKRPVDRFHRAPGQGSTASLEAAMESSDGSGGSWEREVGSIHPHNAPDAQENDEPAHDALDVVEAGGRGSREAATRALWGVMSAATGAQDVRKDHFDRDRADEVRASMDRLGGVRQVLERYSAADETDQDMDTLLQPWGGKDTVADPDERDRIVETLERDPDYTDKVWDAAVLTATSTGRRRKARA